MNCWILLDVVVWNSPAILKSFTSKDKSLLICRNSFFVGDLGFNSFNSVSCLNINHDGLSSQGLNKDLHTSSQSEDQVESWFFVNVIIREGSTIFQLLACKDESLLVSGDAFPVLYFGLDILDGVRGLNFYSHSLSSESFYEDLHLLLVWF